MKIVHICRRFFPAIGGVETHVGEVAKLQAARGNQVWVITQAATKSEIATEKLDGITIFRLPAKTGEHKQAVWKAMSAYSSLLREADVVQIHDVFWWIIPHYLRIARKCYTTFHGWETKFPIPITAKLQRYLYAALSRKTIHIGSWIKKYYWDSPTKVMYGGVHVPKKIYPHSTQLQKGIFLGRLSIDNDCDKFVFLTKILQEEFPGFTMTWVGDGELRSECQTVGKVTGFVADPSNYIEKADVVFAASYLSILQAQALGKPVVSLYSTELKKEYLQAIPTKVSLICREQPVDAYAELAILFEDSERVARVSSTAARLAAQYTWDTVVDEYQKLWQN